MSLTPLTLLTLILCMNTLFQFGTSGPQKYSIMSFVTDAPLLTVTTAKATAVLRSILTPLACCTRQEAWSDIWNTSRT